MYKRDIHLDIDDNLNNYIKSVELDSNSRVWHFHLTVDYEPLDLTGKSVQFRAEKPDKTNVLNDCKIVDAEKGVVEVKLTRQVNAIPGHVKCLLKIIGAEGFVLKTKTFVVDVSKTLSDDAIVSSDEFGVLEAALGKVQDIDNRFAQTNAQLSAIKEHCTGGNGMQEHSHVNKTVLDKFTDSNGSIFYGEKELGGAIKAGSITDDLIAESIKNAYPTNAFKCNLISGNNMTWLQLNCVLENPTSSLIIDTEQIVSYVSNGLTDNCAIWARVSGGDYCKTTNEKLVLGKLITQRLTVPNPNLKTN